MDILNKIKSQSFEVLVKGVGGLITTGAIFGILLSHMIDDDDYDYDIIEVEPTNVETVSD